MAFLILTEEKDRAGTCLTQYHLFLQYQLTQNETSNSKNMIQN